MKTNHDIKLGVSLYSYQDNYYFKRFDLEGCIAAAAGAGAEGIEVFSDAMIREWPYISDAFVDKWNGWMERYGVEPVCLDHFSDRAMWHDKQLTDDEMFERGVMYIKAAKKLGCKAIRVLHEEHIGPFSISGYKLTDYDLIARLLPVAAEHDIMLALEVHTKDGVGAPYQLKYIELAEKTGIPYVGLQADFSTFEYCLSTADITERVARGATREVWEFIREKQREAYFAGEPFEYESIKEEVEKMPLTEADQASLRFFGRRRGNNPTFQQLYADLKQYASKLVYVHGKFYDIDENGQVDNMDYPVILKALQDGGYKGYLSSEFEGNRRMNMVGWCDEIEYVRKHQQLMRKCLGYEDPVF